MGNRDTEATLTYHSSTKHSYESIRSNAHFLDWDNKPLPFKIYETLEGIPLPQKPIESGVSALDAISRPPLEGDCQNVPDLETLAQILYYSAGITKRLEYPGGMEVYFRAAACTGALYHIDLYLVCRDLPGLEAGVYHFGPHDFSLRRLRSGDYLSVLARATVDEPSIARAPVVIVSADTYWRNSWKYQSRAYRHSFWDNGTILANLLAMAAAHNLPARVIVNFVDGEVNRLLGMDGEREVALSLVHLGRVSDLAPDGARDMEELSYETKPLSKTQVDYPAIRAMYEASSLSDEEEVKGLRTTTPTLAHPEPQGKLYPLEPLDDRDMSGTSIEETILRRGSTRRFAREAITFAQLSTALDRATRGVLADFLDPYGSTLNQPYLIVNAVDGLPSGSYLYHREEKALELLRNEDYRRYAGYLGLEQEIPADASADVFFLADLDSILECCGNRGYRMAQLEAAIIGGRLYLAAYAQRLGASGLTFLDDDVIEFFTPWAQGKSVMFLVALGKSVKRIK